VSQALPHRYEVRAAASLTGDVTLDSAGLPTLPSAPPSQYGGPGNRWSPETLLVAAVADCFVLSFRAIAQASRLAWSDLDCEVAGTLDKIDHVTRFTEFEVRARLRIPADQNPERAHRIMEKAEEACLVTRSLSSKVTLHIEVATS